MLIKRASADRGRGHFDWLESWHSFSFGQYYDANHMGFHSLRVINEDIIRGGGGFPMHGHKDMEILTVMVAGTLVHTDSLANVQELRPGYIQLMRAGRGIRHSEFNASATERAHLLQIWLKPAVEGLEPCYQENFLEVVEKRDRFALIVSPEGTDRSLTIAQDAYIYMSELSPKSRIDHDIIAGRAGWIQMISGMVEVNDYVLRAGDGLAVPDREKLEFHNLAFEDASFLLFDLAAIAA